MGVIEALIGFMFGGGRNVIRDTAEVFRANAEAAEGRDAAFRAAVLQQFAAEFAGQRRGWFDRLIDGLNRLPRPALALGTLGLFVAAMVDPIWFAARMQGVALVPEPLWWLLGAVVSFYFGARHQAKGQEFQRSIAVTFARAAEAAETIRLLEAVSTGRKGETNPALAAWRAGDGN
jgi:hypothetical protein